MLNACYLSQLELRSTMDKERTQRSKAGLTSQGTPTPSLDGDTNFRLLNSKTSNAPLCITSLTAPVPNSA